MSARYVMSKCCDAPVVGMVDVTVHPRLREDGTYGPIVDKIRDVRFDAARSEVDAPYCTECGEPFFGPDSEERG